LKVSFDLIKTFAATVPRSVSIADGPSSPEGPVRRQTLFAGSFCLLNGDWFLGNRKLPSGFWLSSPDDLVRDSLGVSGQAFTVL